MIACLKDDNDFCDLTARKKPGRNSSILQNRSQSISNGKRHCQGHFGQSRSRAKPAAGWIQRTSHILVLSADDENLWEI
jgi:hypothetical protein